MSHPRSAVLRLALPAALVFALGSAAVLFVAYRSTVRAVDDQFDALLSSEAADLASEAAPLSPGELPAWLAREREDFLRYLELRSGEGSGTAPAGTPAAAPAPEVSLVITEQGAPIAWVGAADPAPLLRAAESAGVGAVITVHAATGPAAEGRPTGPLRVVFWQDRTTTGSRGGLGSLGSLGDRGALVALTPPDHQLLLHRIGVTLAVLWAAVVLIGSALSWWSVRRVLSRVQRLTGAASAITHPESGQRIPEARQDDEIGRLATTLNGMLERIAAGTREVRDLAAAVAHDLRSPVTVIRGRLELALTHDSETDLRDAAASAIEGLDRVAAILEANLDVAEAEGGALKLRTEPIDPSLLCRELAELYDFAAAEAGITLGTDLEDGLVVEGDPSLLGRALSNLLDNALRHADGATRLRLSTRREDGRWVRIAVEDDGPGFPESLRTRAFERSARRPGSPGLGLGLLLVRAVARAHGGEATLATGAASSASAASSLGGAAVVLRLPLADTGPSA